MRRRWIIAGGLVVEARVLEVIVEIFSSLVRV